MIRIELRNHDTGDFFKNYPEIEMTLDGRDYNAAYLASMFRDFLLGMGFAESTVEEYIPDVGNIESHIKKRFKEKWGAIEESAKVSEESAKVSEESADNVTSPKKDCSDWAIEDWRVEFERWMRDRGAWVAYVEANGSLIGEEIDGGRELFSEISDKYDFLFFGFTWNLHETTFNTTRWNEFDIEWKRHLSDLKGE